MENIFLPSCSQELPNFTWLPMQFETYPWILYVSPETLNAHVILTFSFLKWINEHFHNLVEKPHGLTLQGCITSLFSTGSLILLQSNIQSKSEEAMAALVRDGALEQPPRAKQMLVSSNAV